MYGISEQTTWVPIPTHLSQRKQAFAKSDAAVDVWCDPEGINGGRRSSDGDSDVGGRCRPITDVVITNRGTQSHEKKDSTVDKTILKLKP